jgi:cytochrome c553
MAHDNFLREEIAAMRRMDAQDAQQTMQEERDRDLPRCGECHEQEIINGQCQNCGSITLQP